MPRYGCILGHLNAVHAMLNGSVGPVGRFVGENGTCRNIVNLTVGVRVHDAAKDSIVIGLMGIGRCSQLLVGV